jgi:hypothetical protein
MDTVKPSGGCSDAVTLYGGMLQLPSTVSISGGALPNNSNGVVTSTGGLSTGSLSLSSSPSGEGSALLPVNALPTTVSIYTGSIIAAALPLTLYPTLDSGSGDQPIYSGPTIAGPGLTSTIEPTMLVIDPDEVVTTAPQK